MQYSGTAKRVKASDEDIEKRLDFHRKRTKKVLSKMVKDVQKEFGDVRNDDFDYMLASIIHLYNDNVINKLDIEDAKGVIGEQWNAICGAVVTGMYRNHYDFDAATARWQEVVEELKKFAVKHGMEQRDE